MDAANEVVSLLKLYKVQVSLTGVLIISLVAIYLSGVFHLLAVYVGDANCHLAVTKNHECEQFYKAGPESEAYLNCKHDLETIVHRTIIGNFMNPYDCVTIEGRPNAVLCKIYTFFVPKEIVVTDDLIVSFFKNRNIAEQEVKKISEAVDEKEKLVELNTYKDKGSQPIQPMQSTS